MGEMKDKKIALWGLLSGLFVPGLLDIFLDDKSLNIVLAWIIIPILAVALALGTHKTGDKASDLRAMSKNYIFGLVGFGLLWLLAILVFSIVFANSA